MVPSIRTCVKRVVLECKLLFWGLVHRNMPREMDDKEEKWPKLHLQAILGRIPSKGLSSRTREEVVDDSGDDAEGEKWFIRFWNGPQDWTQDNTDGQCVQLRAASVFKAAPTKRGSVWNFGVKK
jgi:hypothetical protein